MCGFCGYLYFAVDIKEYWDQRWLDLLGHRVGNVQFDVRH
jgi:hypothetical protein